MKKKNSYKTTDVEHIDVTALLQLALTACIIAIDVAKTRFVAAIANTAGGVLEMVRFEHPRQTLAFLALVRSLRDGGMQPSVVMEPTGTYGDSLRFQLDQLGVAVHMMPPKFTHDFSEVMDGVPGMNDPKAASVLARLQAVRPARQWKAASEEQRDLRALLGERIRADKELHRAYGTLESLLARHWPELGRYVNVYDQRSWMQLLIDNAGPNEIAKTPEAAIQMLRKASRYKMPEKRCREIVESAVNTLGMPTTAREAWRLASVVEDIKRLREKLGQIDAVLQELAAQKPVVQRLSQLVGVACATAIVSLVGSPEEFRSTKAFIKAMGLNLVDNRSGDSKRSQRRISKRGPAQVRQLLVLAALRFIQRDPYAAAWYRNRSSFKASFTSPGQEGPKSMKMKAVIALVRKLVMACWHVGQGATYDAKKLFDVRRLTLDPNTDSATAATRVDRFSPRTASPRAAAAASSSPSTRQLSNPAA